MVCHGIPDDRELCNGDIINIDVTVLWKNEERDIKITLDSAFNELPFYREEIPLHRFTLCKREPV